MSAPGRTAPICESTSDESHLVLGGAPALGFWLLGSMAMKPVTVVLLILVILAVVGLPVLVVLPHGDHAMPGDSHSSAACAVACLMVSAVFIGTSLTALLRRFVYDVPLLYSGADTPAVDPPPPRALLT